MQKAKLYDLRRKSSQVDIVVLELTTMKKIAELARLQLEQTSLYEIKDGLIEKIRASQTHSEVIDVVEDFLEVRKAISILSGGSIPESNCELVDYERGQEQQ